MSVTPLNIHIIDSAGTIVQVNQAWVEFALANQYPGDPRSIIGRSLWREICDLETRCLYQTLVERAVQGGPLQVEYRCDSPSLRRFMAMTISREAGAGRVAFVNRVLRTEQRPYQSLLDPAQARTDQAFLRLCGWCKRAELATPEWVEIEEAVQRLRLFGDKRLPRLTHGICPGCKERITRVSM